MVTEEAMETINSLIGQMWLSVTVAAVVFLVVVNGFKDQPRAVREAVDTVVSRSGHLVVWFALALMVPYSVLATLNAWGVWLLVVTFVLAAVSLLAPPVGKIWRKLHPSPVGEHETRLLTVLKARGATVRTFFAHDTLKAVRDDVTALSQEMTLLRDSITGERDEARQELAELRAKVQALPERLRNKHDLR